MNGTLRYAVVAVAWSALLLTTPALVIAAASGLKVALLACLPVLGSSVLVGFIFRDSIREGGKAAWKWAVWILALNLVLGTLWSLTAASVFDLSGQESFSMSATVLVSWALVATWPLVSFPLLLGLAVASSAVMNRADRWALQTTEGQGA